MADAVNRNLWRYSWGTAHGLSYFFAGVICVLLWCPGRAGCRRSVICKVSARVDRQDDLAQLSASD